MGGVLAGGQRQVAGGGEGLGTAMTLALTSTEN